MKLIAHTLITLLALAPAIPTYAMHTTGGKSEMDTTDDNGESITVRRSGKKRKQREISLDSESQPDAATEANKKAKKFKCDHQGCTRSFDKNRELIDHNERNHNPSNSFKCTEPGCTERFKKAMGLKGHMIKYHPKKRATHKCDHQGCTRSFNSNSQLKKHEKTHNLLNPFPCQEPGCTEGFESMHGLRTHMGVYHRKKRVASDATVSSASDMAPSSTSSSATLPLPAPATESTASSSDQSVIGFLPPVDHSAVLMESSVPMDQEPARLMAGLLASTLEKDSDENSEKEFPSSMLAFTEPYSLQKFDTSQQLNTDTDQDFDSFNPDALPMPKNWQQGE